MKIITVNLPESYIKAMDKLYGDNGIYPSRSELIRVAVREFLIKELEASKSFDNLFSTIKQQQQKPRQDLIPKVDPLIPQIVQIQREDGTLKTYRIIKK